jgi:hypothetical protein
MRYLTILLIALALAAGLGNAHAASISSQPPSQAAAQSLLKYAQSESSYCRHLRYACIYENRLGEAGEGNCRRYKEECRGFGDGGYGYGGRRYEGRSSYCERLRDSCIYKESRGETGEGNCRRYREECRE